MRLAPALVGFVAIACGACDLTGEPADSESVARTSAAAATPTPGGPDGCGSPLVPGSQRLLVERRDGQESALLFVPSSYEENVEAALVIAFSDDDRSAADFASYSALIATAEARSFLALFPEPPERGWRGDAADLALSADLIETLRVELCLDLQRVFAAGFREGALIANALACEGGAPGGVAVVQPPPLPACAVGTPLSVIGFVGAPPSGIDGVAAKWARAWALVDGCREPPVNQSRIPGHRLEIYTFCRPGFVVALYTIEDSGNSWPGADSMDALSASDEIARFFGLRR